MRVCGGFRRERFQFTRHPHSRAAQGDTAPKLAEQMDIGPGHAAVQDVAQDGDVQIFEGAFAIADGKRIEERLRGMLVRAVAGVDHRNFEARSHKMWRAGGAVAHHDAVGFHGFEGADGIKQRFAFFQAGGLGLEDS